MKRIMAFCVLALTLASCIPRDPHPERTPSPMLPCVMECGYGQ